MSVPPPRSTRLFSVSAFDKMLSSFFTEESLKDLDRKKLYGNVKTVDATSVEFIQKLLDLSNHRLRMFGSAKRIAEDLQAFGQFPASHQYFGFSLLEFYHIPAYTFMSLKKEIFVTKFDVFNGFESQVLCKNPVQIPSPIVTKFFKSLERKMCGKLEFLRFDSSLFAEFDKVYDKINEEVMRTVDTQHLKYLPKTLNPFAEIKNHWKSLMPECTDAEHNELLEWLYDSGNLGLNIWMHAQFIHSSKVLIKVIGEFVDAHPDTFLPYTEKNIKNAPVVVRIFLMDPMKRVMITELFEAINIRNPNDPKFVCHDKPDRLTTIEMADVYKLFGTKIANIEFVRDNVGNLPYQAIPTVSPAGGFCVLARPAFCDVMIHVILVEKVFQKIKSDTWHVVEEFMEKMEQFFSPDPTYFISCTSLDKFKQEVSDFWKPYRDVPTKLNRNAKTDGFTVENLKNELKYLGVTDVLPECDDHAQAAFNLVYDARRQEVLNTYDLFQAVACCQMICVQKRFTFIKTFTESQGILDDYYFYCFDPDDTLRKKLTGNTKSVAKHGPTASKLAGLNRHEHGVCAENEFLKRSTKCTVIKKRNDLHNKGTVCTQCIDVETFYEKVKKQVETSTERLEKAEKKEKNNGTISENLKILEKELVLVKQDVEDAKSAEFVAKKSLENVENEMNKEIEMLRNQVSALSTEADAMKLEVPCDDKALEDSQKTLEEARQQLAAEDSKCQAELKKAKEGVQKSKQKSAEIRKKLNEKFESNDASDEELKKLQEANLKLTIDDEKQEKMMEMIVENLSDSSMKTVKDCCKNCEFEKRKLRFLKIRDSLKNGESLKMAKEMTQKLISMTPGRSEMHKMANNEYEQFEGKINGYVELVEMNIKKMKETNESSELIPLPTEYPSLSDQFMNQFWAEVDQKQKEKKKDSEVASDSECGICFFEMKPRQKTMQCEECKKVMHFKCAKRWLAVAKSCPFCRRKMLDPTEFPPLA